MPLKYMSADLHVNSKAWLAGDPKHSFQAWQRRVPRRGKAIGMSYDVIEYHDTNSSLKITEVLYQFIYVYLKEQMQTFLYVK